MKRFILSFSALLFLSFSLTGQDKTDYATPSYVRNGSNDLPNQVDLIWTPPPGWIPSPVDRWYDYDQGIYGDNGLGSCPGCPVEIAIRWDSAYFDFYDSVYISKIRYVLREAPLDHALRVYQVLDNIFDTLLNYPLEQNLMYFSFDTLEFDPIPVEITKELWVSLWISDLGPGFPMAVAWSPAFMDGNSNMVKVYNQGYWETLTDMTGWDYSWNMGAFLETPNDSVIYPVFNVYRALDDLPYEKIHEGQLYDTIYHDYLQNINASSLHYYVTCVYEDGESEPSDTLYISLVGIPEIVKGKINVYPNPAKDKVSIDSGNGKINSLSLINTKGEVVLEKLFNTEKVQLDLSGITSAFYILKVITDDGVFTSKLLIVK